MIWRGSSRLCCVYRVTQLSHKTEAEDQAWLSGQNRPDRFGVAGGRKLRGGGHEVQLPGIHLMVLRRQIPKVPLVGVYLSLGLSGILYFSLASI
jgi:hypothetical protein